MAFSYTNTKERIYYLHHKNIKMINGSKQTICFFAKDVREDDALDAVPEGYVVGETKNGLPVLKKIA